MLKNYMKEIEHEKINIAFMKFENIFIIQKAKCLEYETWH